MATTPLLLETNPLKWKQSYKILYSPLLSLPTNSLLSKHAMFNGIGIFKLQGGSAKFISIKCLMEAKSCSIQVEHCSSKLGIKEMNTKPAIAVVYWVCWMTAMELQTGGLGVEEGD